MGNYTGLFERRLWHGRTTKVVLAVLVGVVVTLVGRGCDGFTSLIAYCGGVSAVSVEERAGGEAGGGAGG